MSQRRVAPRARQGLVRRPSSHLSPGIVHTLSRGVSDGHAAAGGRGGLVGPVQAQVARPFRVSRRWVITLVQRFLTEGEGGVSALVAPPATA